MITSNQSIKDIKDQTMDQIHHKQIREKKLAELLNTIREQMLGEDKEMRTELEILKSKVLESLRQERKEVKDLLQQLAELENISTS